MKCILIFLVILLSACSSGTTRDIEGCFLVQKSEYEKDSYLFYNEDKNILMGNLKIVSEPKPTSGKSYNVKLMYEHLEKRVGYGLRGAIIKGECK